MSRRQVLHAAALAAASGWAGGGAARAQGGGQTAVVFLSRSGNTRMLAGHLSRRFNADLIEVRPRDPWPDDYDRMVDWASRWREGDQLLPLEHAPDLSGHDTVFLGFPIWGGSLPAPMRSFLTAADLSGKTVLPFITHGGYGPGNTMAAVHGLAPNASFMPEFILRCDQERDTLNALRGWLSDVSAQTPL
ncbi:flavodoxin [Tropicimonas sp.]|uniref:flavodoxin n=1 Tax=Tropicimonas sp. TaxID=2067044 RepID=UPI003A837628